MNPHPPSVRHQLFALAVFLLVFPFFMKRRPRVERGITICKTPEEIFPFLEELKELVEELVAGPAEQS